MKLAIFVFLLAAAYSGYGQAEKRTIAITIDDLPVVSTRGDLKNRQEITKKLLAHLTNAKVPAIGFVNENKLYSGGIRDAQQINFLKMWLDAGFELGNHTYSHRSLNNIALDDYQADLIKGESITREMLGQKGKKIQYFRHPYLQTGRSMEVKGQFGKFLKQHKYIVAPVTFDNADYIFSRAYDIAFDKGDMALMKKVGDAYVPYMEAKLEYWERQSMKLFGREISQTLLTHANFINADYMDDLAAMFKRRGYKIISLEQALKDRAYELPDTYVGPAGISWLHRWARERGKEFVIPGEPSVPEFVLKLSGFESE